MEEGKVSREDESQEQSNQNGSQEQEFSGNDFFSFDYELMLLLLILLIFFSKRDVFSEQLQSLNQQASNIKNYLEAADATLQALDQASQMPKQILN